MMTQEEYMDVMAMKRQGLTINEIAEETGYHPATISKWLKLVASSDQEGDDPGGHRRALVEADRSAADRGAAVIGHERVRDHANGGLQRLVSVGCPATARAARPELSGPAGCVGADRDRTG